MSCTKLMLSAVFIHTHVYVFDFIKELYQVIDSVSPKSEDATKPIFILQMCSQKTVQLNCTENSIS